LVNLEVSQLVAWFSRWISRSRDGPSGREAEKSAPPRFGLVAILESLGLKKLGPHAQDTTAAESTPVVDRARLEFGSTKFEEELLSVIEIPAKSQSNDKPEDPNSTFHDSTCATPATEPLAETALGDLRDLRAFVRLGDRVDECSDDATKRTLDPHLENNEHRSSVNEPESIGAGALTSCARLPPATILEQRELFEVPTCRTVSLADDVEALGLSRRAVEALREVEVTNVGQLLSIEQAGLLSEVINLKWRHVQDIRTLLSQIKLADSCAGQPVEPSKLPIQIEPNRDKTLEPGRVQESAGDNGSVTFPLDQDLLNVFGSLDIRNLADLLRKFEDGQLDLTDRKGMNLAAIEHFAGQVFFDLKQTHHAKSAIDASYAEANRTSSVALHGETEGGLAGAGLRIESDHLLKSLRYWKCLTVLDLCRIASKSKGLRPHFSPADVLELESILTPFCLSRQAHSNSSATSAAPAEDGSVLRTCGDSGQLSQRREVAGIAPRDSYRPPPDGFPPSWEEIVTEILPQAVVPGRHSDLHAESLAGRDYGRTEQRVDSPSSAAPRVTLSDSLSVLDLSVRAHNALLRNGVATVGDLLRLLESNALIDIKQLGPRSIREIEGRLRQFVLLDRPELENRSRDDFETNLGEHLVRVATKRSETRRRDSETLAHIFPALAKLIEKEIASGLLHPHVVADGKRVCELMEMAPASELDRVVKTILSVVSSSPNICDELCVILGKCSDREIRVIVQRNMRTPATLEELSRELLLTRERVRQIEQKAVRKIAGMIGVMKAPGCDSTSFEITGQSGMPFARIQSALLIGRDMGFGSSYLRWENEIASSGLLGQLASGRLPRLDPALVMLAVCRAASKSGYSSFQIPENLEFAIEAAEAGDPNASISALRARSSVDIALVKLIDRHCRASGAVNPRWLALENGMEQTVVEDSVLTLGYKPCVGEWYVPTSNGVREVTRNDVFHTAVRKMLRHCGPLKIEEICAGLRSKASRKGFPVPPAEVVAQVLASHGYRIELDLYYSGEAPDLPLGEGESAMIEILRTDGPVVHTTRLALDFLRHRLSHALLTQTIAYSPLFKDLGRGLYCLRGTTVTPADIEKAMLARKHIPLNLEIDYDADEELGCISIFVTLGIAPIATGTIVSTNLPNLTGKWTCLVGDRNLGEIEATQSKLRHLRSAFNAIDCLPGDRIRIIFNTFKRTAKVERAHD
jgi:hypothetical protein